MTAVCMHACMRAVDKKDPASGQIEKLNRSSERKEEANFYLMSCPVRLETVRLIRISKMNLIVVLL